MRDVRRNDGSVAVRSWAADMQEQGVLAQALSTADAKGVAGPVALMPDAHVGKGASIGSVVVTEGTVIPAAVGVDLGCGMTAVRTSVTSAQLPDDLSAVLDGFAEAVPAVWRSDDAPYQPREWLDLLASTPPPSDADLAERAAAQVGTLGSGNHFLELSEDSEGGVWVVAHSGSRGAGNMLASKHIKVAGQADPVADPDLATLQADTPEYAAYIADMLWAQGYARWNRHAVTAAALRAFYAALGRPAPEGGIPDAKGGGVDVDCHHNYAQVERHLGRDLLVTRKGAISARRCERGIIPGSMGTSTFIVEGLGNLDSYCSAAHGAGRRLSRGEAKRKFKVEDLHRQMAGNTAWLKEKAADLLDEAPEAYKDIAEVMAQQADLCTPVMELRALVNYKGT